MDDRNASTVSGNMPDEFDRLLGLLDGLNGVTHVRGTTITVTPPLGVGGSRTFIIQTYRQRDELDEKAKAQDTIFLQMVHSGEAIRIAIPGPVADVIARQRDALTTITRKRIARQSAAVRKAAGIKPSAETIAAMHKGLAKHRKEKAAKKAKKG
jgi:hypothetical protein